MPVLINTLGHTFTSLHKTVGPVMPAGEVTGLWSPHLRAVQRAQVRWALGSGAGLYSLPSRLGIVWSWQL